MEKNKMISRSLLIVTMITVLILLIPFIAMQFTNEVNWQFPDFILMGSLIFGTGASFVWIVGKGSSFAYKSAIGLALASTFLLIWANLAVGLIGSGPNLGNLMYFGVVVTAITGIVLSRFQPTGMERAMYATAFSLVLLATIALMANVHKSPGASVAEIIVVNGFFSGLYTVAGFLFRYSAHLQAIEKS